MRFVVGLLALLLVSLLPFSAIFADAIPGNCEYTQSPEQLALFPRYSQSTGRLVLVSWTTGEEVRTLAEGISFVSAVGWSADCRYLAIAEGTPEVMNTVVYDTQTSQRMGSVDDAHQQPHPITWGPNDYLVVETRNGGILWHVPTGMQVQLSDSYNTTTARNFNRLRWDAANNQLIADLAVGGRVVYDLTTGAQVPVMVQAPEVQVQSDDSFVVVGGRPYLCEPGWGLALDYDDESHVVSVKLTYYGGSGGRPDSTLLTIEDGIDASWFAPRGWSTNCRYAAASFGVPGEDASTTVVYDIVTGRRVGEIPDAHLIMHPIHWSPDGDTLIVETRHGAVLWHLPTNTKTLINDTAEEPASGSSTVRNFAAMLFVDGGLLNAPLSAPNTLVVSDLSTGNERVITTLSSPVTGLQQVADSWVIAFLQQGDNQYIAPAVFVNLSTGDQVQATLRRHYYWHTLEFTVGPTERFATWIEQGVLRALDMDNGIEVGPFSIEGDRYHFISDTRIAWSHGPSIDLETGNQVTLAVTADNPVRKELIGQNGETGWYGGHSRCQQNRSQAFYRPATRELMVVRHGHESSFVTDLNNIRDLTWSPDCRIISGRVAVITNEQGVYDQTQVDDIYSDRTTYVITFWDASSGSILTTIPSPYRYNSHAVVTWSPGSERAFVRTADGHFIVDPYTGAQILLRYDPDTASQYQITSYPELYWDFEHGRLFVSAWGGVLAFDLWTGEQIALLVSNPTAGPAWPPGQYFLQGDYVEISLSENGQDLHLLGQSSAAQYDFLTLEGVQVSTPDNSLVYHRRVASSPDNHYMVMAYGKFWVWDLTNLSEEFNDRGPMLIFNGPNVVPETITFVDNVTLAATDYYGNTTYWNVETGEEVTLSPS